MSVPLTILKPFPPPKSMLDHSDNPVNRNTMTFLPSIWGDQFLDYNENKEQVQEERRLVEELREEVRKELLISSLNEKLQHMKLVELIDAVQRLGIAYHFEEEIEEALHHIYEIYAEDWIGKDNLHNASLWFRLLRQQGFNVSSGIFKIYMDERGDFKESLSDDVQGLLALYEASYMRVEGEEILDNALAFTTAHLERIAKDPLHHSDPSVKVQIQQALRQPLRKRMPRAEALRFIPIYQEEASHHESLLKLAKLDFNLLQSLHKKELSKISKWWKDLDFKNKLPYVRDRVVEGYFWILGLYFEPQYSRSRIFLMKACMLVVVLDDTYDNYGIYEELEIFTEAVQRWSLGCIDMLPEYMKPIYQELMDVHKEMEELVANEGKAFHMYYAKQMVKEYTRSLLAEAKWVKEGHIPTFEEHMSVSLVTCGYAMMIAKSYVGLGDIVTEESFEWLSTFPPLVKASCSVCRLMNDIATHKEEQEREHAASTIECYMKQHGGSKEYVCDLFSKQVENAWKVMNRDSLRPTTVPMPLIMPAINLARVCDILYKDGDGYGHAGKEIKRLIRSLLVDPIVV